MNRLDDEKRTIKIVQALFEGMTKVVEVAGDEDYAEYVAFVSIGRVIAAKHGLARLLDYLSEIDAHNPMIERKNKKETRQ